jgi:ATP-dependent helicase/DNAse subunit B
LTPRQPRAVGFSREKIFQSQSTEVCKDWDLFLAESQEEVQRLAREFVLGRAAVDPIKSACEYCHIKPFCRVNENTTQGPQEE